MRASDVPNTVWTREGPAIVEATAKTLGNGHYQVDFVDSAGNVLNVLRLSETALLNLAATVGELIDQLERPGGSAPNLPACTNSSGRVDL